MITTTMRRLVPDELITPLKILGKYDWLRWTPIDTSPPTTSLEVRFPTDPALLELYPHLIALIHRLLPIDSLLLYELYAQSKAMAEGPKLLCPTTEQCEALEYVDVNISFDDYVQPFPDLPARTPPGLPPQACGSLPGSSAPNWF